VNHGPINPVHPAITKNKHLPVIGGVRGAGVNPNYIRKGGKTGALMDAVQSMIQDPVVSGLQIANEYENFNNPMINPVGSVANTLFGKDWVARGIGNAAEQIDKYANTAPNKNSTNMNKQAKKMAAGEVTPMDFVNVSSLIPVGEGIGLGAKGLLKLAEVAAPKLTHLEPAAQLVGGGITTRIPGQSELKSILENYGRATKAAPSTISASNNIVYASTNQVDNIREPHETKGKSGHTNGSVIASNASTNVKRRGGSVGVNADEIASMADSARADLPNGGKINQTYVDRYNASGKDPKRAWEVGHDPGKPATTKPTHFVSRDLNELERHAAADKQNFDNYADVIKWAIKLADTNAISKNGKAFKVIPQLKGMNFDEAVSWLGAEHLV
jgi:hypothetical protein